MHAKSDSYTLSCRSAALPYPKHGRRPICRRPCGALVSLSITSGISLLEHDCAHCLRSFVCRNARILRGIHQLPFHLFLVLLSLLFCCCFLPFVAVLPSVVSCSRFPDVFRHFVSAWSPAYAFCRKLQRQVRDCGDRRWQTCCSPRVAGNDDVRGMLQAKEVAKSSAPHTTGDDAIPTKTRFIVEDDSVIFSIAVLTFSLFVFFFFFHFDSCVVAVLIVFCLFRFMVMPAALFCFCVLFFCFDSRIGCFNLFVFVFILSVPSRLG